MTTRWIDFALVKGQASFSAVLDRYGIKHQNSHGQASVLCPFHKDRQPSLSVSFSDNIFHCFSCDAKGTVLDFVAKMEKVSIPEAARIVADLCGIPMDGQKPPEGRHRKAGDGSGALRRVQGGNGSVWASPRDRGRE